MPIIEKTRQVGLAGGAEKLAHASYSFATHGGAVGDITLTGDTIPSGAVIVDAVLKVSTVLTSGGAATVAIKVEGAADINAADAISGAPWSTATAQRADFTATTAVITTTAARSIVATVGTAALTAGAFQVVVKYIEFAA